ncbi:MAG: ABC transporter permease [Candidatus Aminicenantes bacterium]|nr:ABC transporter permease [Candidatus Aminicenantes bacterium]
MWYPVKLAWRNIFRNKRRTYITAVAIGLGLASLIFSDAFIIGMKKNMIQSATSSFLGEAQIHQKGYRLTREVEKTVNNLPSVVKSLEGEDLVDRFALRTLTFGMITSPADVNSVLLVGIEPDKERKLSRIDDAINRGEFLSSETGRDIVIGSKLAEILDVGLGDRVVATCAQAGTGDLSQEMFRIAGIYTFNVREMDTGMAFIPLKKAQQMLGLENDVHEIAVKFKNMEDAAKENLPLWQKYSQEGNEMVSWAELLPDLKSVFEMTGIMLMIIGVILFAIVTFGVVNTLFMSLYERLFEFGVLRAVGTRPGGVRRLIILEAGAMALISIFVGAVLGFLLTFIFTKTGVDYRGIEFAGSTIYEMLYPVIHIRQYIIYPLAVFIFTLIIGLYPATVAARMSVTDAMRKSL